MLQLVKTWLSRYILDPELAILWLFLIFIVVVFAVLGKILAPVLVSVVIAYLLQWPISSLEKLRFPKVAAVLSVYISFIGIVVLGIVGLLPLLVRQLSNLIAELPNMAARGQEILLFLPSRYPDYLSATQIQDWILQFKSGLTHFGQWILSASLVYIPNIIAFAIYFVLVPLLVYFFLIDEKKIIAWITQYLPERRRLISQVWREAYAQTGNYVRGKALEMLIVWIVTYLSFALLGLQYAMLLSVLVGVSVIIPYIGAVMVTIPVLIIGSLQWGWSAHFAYLVAIYAIIITLDANVLVPFLFSEAVDLHPVTIIIAVLIFGGLLGFWGVFFAIPLASVMKAILNAVAYKKPVSTKQLNY
ncbi:membrane protein PerM family [Candidatus Rickettsiella viridis]|uniref:Membrane protein PerM family n=1 Tax=Candidatus Rickettsiella viridis TaxID=676208 RepID=A0A2Z5UUV9_9COXI|nr:AI-2E family transporter [Candidatus Rickettsiella viridis]BBB14733.1 membrane protein PerM family [Candidatus Rickettsiella viridis]